MSAWHEHHLNRTWNVHKSPMLQSSWNPRITKPKFLSPHSKPWKGQNSLLSIASWAYGKQGMNNNNKKLRISLAENAIDIKHLALIKRKKAIVSSKNVWVDFCFWKLRKKTNQRRRKSVHESHEKRIGRTGMNEESGRHRKETKWVLLRVVKFLCFIYLGITLILKEQLVEDEETTLVWTRVEQLCGFFGQPRYCGGRSRLLHT